MRRIDGFRTITSAGARRREPAAPRLSGREILIVEDDPPPGRPLAAAVARAGADVTLECGGRSATDAALRRLRRGRPFDAVVFDLRRDSSGPAAVAALREAGYRGAAVALADGLGGRVADGWRTAGCDGVVPRPDADRVVPAILAELAPAPD